MLDFHAVELIESYGLRVFLVANKLDKRLSCQINRLNEFYPTCDAKTQESTKVETVELIKSFRSRSSATSGDDKG